MLVYENERFALVGGLSKLSDYTSAFELIGRENVSKTIRTLSENQVVIRSF